MSIYDYYSCYDYDLNIDRTDKEIKVTIKPYPNYNLNKNIKVDFIMNNGTLHSYILKGNLIKQNGQGWCKTDSQEIIDIVKVIVSEIVFETNSKVSRFETVHIPTIKERISKLFKKILGFFRRK